MNTIDLIRLYERGSPLQKFWVLVFLLAFKDGARRVWYDPAQGDNRLGYEIEGVEYALVPPPEHLQALLPKVVDNLLRRRSVWSLIAGLFDGSTGRSAPREDTFVAKFKGQRITVFATLDMASSRVVLRFSSETRAAPAAHAALEFLLRNTPQAELREFPEEEL